MSKITHELALKSFECIKPKELKSYNRVLKWIHKNDIDILENYIKQQEKKDELLKLYQDRFSFWNFDEDIDLKKIKELEKELNT